MSFSALMLMVPQFIDLNLSHWVNFCILLTFLYSKHLNKFIAFDKSQAVVDFGRSFCFPRTVRCFFVENLTSRCCFAFFFPKTEQSHLLAFNMGVIWVCDGFCDFLWKWCIRQNPQASFGIIPRNYCHVGHARQDDG